MASIHDKAMLVDLHISQWTARRYDKKVSKQATDSNNATQDAGRFNKALLSRKALRRITSAVSDLRTYHSERTLPWGKSGSRLLPATEYFAYMEGINTRKAEFEDAVTEFVNNYPAYIADAKLQLNNMFNADDYPEIGDIHSKYRMDVSVSPVPKATDFRIDLGDAEVNRLREDMRKRAEAAQQQATSDLWNRLHEVVQNMATRLANEDSTFRNSLIENIRIVVGLLPGLNITDDPALENVRSEVEASLCSLSPEALRTSPDKRRESAAKAQEIVDKMAGFMGGSR